MFRRTILTFLWILTLGFSSSVFAAPIEGDLSLKNFDVPASLGKVDERFEGTSERTIIHIQDVHAQFIAQENISAICEHLQQNYGMEVFALEGMWTPTSMLNSRRIKNSQKKQILFRNILEDAYITGPVYAAAFSHKDIQLVGLEDEAVYETNREIYREHFKLLKDLTTEFSSQKKSMKEKLISGLNPELSKFAASLFKYRDESEILKFVPDLTNAAKKLNLNLEEFSQVVLFEKLIELQSGINMKQLQKDVMFLMQKHREGTLSFEEMVRNELIPEKLLEKLPNLRKYIDLMNLQTGVSYHDFVKESDLLIMKVKEGLLQNEEESQLLDQAERFYLYLKAVTLHLTPRDYEKVLKEQIEIAEELPNDLAKKVFELSLDFYEKASYRDQVFFERITESPDLEGDIVVVTGGFHTKGLSKKFRDSGISYITVTPDLGGELPNMDLYEKRMMEHFVAVQTLVQMANSPAKIDERILALMAAFEDNPLKAMDMFRGFFREIQVEGVDVSTTINDLKDMSNEDLLAWFESISKSEEVVYEVMSETTLLQFLKEEGGSAYTSLLQQKGIFLVLVVELKNEISNPEDRALIESFLESIPSENKEVLEAWSIDNRAVSKKRLLTSQESEKVVFITGENIGREFVRLKEQPESILIAKILALHPGLRAYWMQNPGFFDELLSLIEKVQWSDQIQTAA